MFTSSDTVSWLINFLQATPHITKVMELGSGQSTVRIAQEISGRPGAALISVEEDRAYATQTIIQLEQARMLNVAFVAYFPLDDRALDGIPCRSYSFPESVLPWGAELLFVDGPSSGGLARARAILDVRQWMSQECLVVLDDANRADEQGCIEALLKHGMMFGELVPTERGLATMSLT